MSARLRLTLSYAGFLVIAGGAQAVLLLYVIRFMPEVSITTLDGFSPGRADLLTALWPRIWQVLAVLAVVGLIGGWLLAGRMLRPLQRINSVAREVAGGSLDRRVGLKGPHDEFRELAETFDDMLDRLQRSFDEQRRFAANAAHELRTPQAITQSMLDVARADPSGQDVERLVNRLDETNRRGMEVVEALLALSVLDQGRLPDWLPVDVAETASEVVAELRPMAAAAGVEVRSALGEGDIDGSPTLIRQLLSNIVVNAIRHNVSSGGWLSVRTSTSPDGVVQIVVQNSGRIIAPDLVDQLTEPFVRGAGRVAGRRSGGGSEGSGLGLALVARVSQVHGATLHIRARQAGGLTVSVGFPALTADALSR